MASDHHHHDHDHHDHSHAPAEFGRAFALGMALNLGFVAVEIGYGLIAHSMALLADAGHNLGDGLGLAAAWAGHALSRRAPSPRYSYGLGGATILAALFNALLLLVATGAIAWEAILRLAAPEPIAGATVMIVAAAGVAVNGVTAWLFTGGQSDLNMRAAFMHMLADALVSAGVVAAGLVIALTGWLWLDSIASLAIAATIFWGTWGLLRETVGLSLAAAPEAVDPEAVRAVLTGRPQVEGLHDLHIWAISTSETALTCHLVTPGGHPGDEFLHDLAHELAHRFRIRHATFQIETDPKGRCALAPDRVV